MSFALAFFDRALRERLPLSPPLQAPRARRTADAGDAGASTTLIAIAPTTIETPYDEDGGT